LFDWLTEQVSNNPITYLVVFAATGGDVIVPLIPSETIVITAGIVAAHGGLMIWVLILLAAAGAFLGDNISYWLGRTIGDPIARRLFRGDEGRQRIKWAERAVRRHGAPLILVGRFIPGGRTASTFAAGTLEMPYCRFLIADVLATTLWGAYASMLGYIGGESFRDSLWKPLAISLGIATAIGVAVEGWRQVQKWRGKDILGDQLES
jgi:membrane-associated protein